LTAEGGQVRVHANTGGMLQIPGFKKKTMKLKSLKTIEDLRKVSKEELPELAADVRDLIIDTTSKIGGHLAPSLGVVELTIALHYVFNTPMDKIIWDVGHQTYAHKILTGRRDEFPTIRQYGGISGFPKMNESPFDVFNTGHSSTSLSLAIGEAVGRDLQKQNYKVIAVIGDGSMTGGMAFEALNQIGHMDQDLIIILNDNEHSISKNVGALSTYLTRMISGGLYNKFRRKSMQLVRGIPRIGDSLFRAIEKVLSSVKNFLIPGNFFQDLGIRYFGPVDGHNLEHLCELLERVKHINSGPKIIHVITQKGRGYRPAELDPSRFHGLGPFDKATGIGPGSGTYESFSIIAGKTLAHLAGKDKKLVAVTAAMKLGTGLSEFERVAPNRIFDVGIAEQHAITFSAALSRTGMKPFVAIYSTFLQRATDQLIHDVGIMNLPVKILIDRSGIVGDDGETHHGLFDIGIVRAIPNFIFLAPSSAEELRDMIHFAAGYNEGPVAIRFPRGKADVTGFSVSQKKKFVPGKLKTLARGDDLAVFALGDMVETAKQVRDILLDKGIKITVADLRSIRPIDRGGIIRLVKSAASFITLENGHLKGGVNEEILSIVPPEFKNRFLFAGGFPDEFIGHGSSDQLFQRYSLDAPSLARRIIKALA